MAKLTAHHPAAQPLDLRFNDHRKSFRSIDGAVMASSLFSPDLSELVECFASYLLSLMSKEPRRCRTVLIDEGLFNKVKPRSDSFAELVRDTVNAEPRFAILEDSNETEPTLSSVSNYLRNVLTSCRFRLECLPLAAHYLRRLLRKKVVRLTAYNFRRLSLVTMLLAHKLYNDDALRCRAGALQFLKAQELFEAERALLCLLDYCLVVSPEEYANSYLRLRSHVQTEAITHRNV